MQWSEMYTIEDTPSTKDINHYINSPLWNDLCHFIEETYSVSPIIEYSKCSMARGWNVKYKKGSKSICTVYPNKDYFTCMIVIGSKEATETEYMLGSCDPYIVNLYHNTNPFNGSRWLMIDVTNNKILEDVKSFIEIRMKKKK